MANYAASFEPSAPPSSRTPPRASHKARGRALLAMLVAASAGLTATVLLARYIARRTPAVATAAVPMRQLAVAKRELPLATTLTAEMIGVAEWPSAAVPANAFDSGTALVGRVVRTPMVPGEPFTEPRLAAKGGGDGLSAVIPSYLRAMTVRVNEASGVAGFIHPGDSVDVIATMAPHANDPELRSRIVLQNIRVVAVGEELSAQNAKPIKVPVVTLLVAPEQAERLALASSHGELQLIMRPGADAREVETPGISPPELYEDGSPAPACVAAAEPPARPARGKRSAEASARRSHRAENDVVEIIHGARSEERKLRSVSKEK